MRRPGSWPLLLLVLLALTCPAWARHTETPATCAYRATDGGPAGRLCFRRPLRNFTCERHTCRQVRAPGGHLEANVLSNGTVLLRWPRPPAGEPRGGFRMSCRWNGSLTQFECAGAHLGGGCRDYLLSELHLNVVYRVCLWPAARPGGGECVEFTLSPAAMQDMVIAMTTVGGAICVMLVVICLLVAYITENIMSPSGHHGRAHNTYL